MLHYAQPFGHVRVWQDGEQWRYVPAGEWAPENAQLAKMLDDDGEHVIYIHRGNSGEFVRGAVQG